MHTYKLFFHADNSPRTRILEVIATNKAEAQRYWPNVKENWKPLKVKLDKIIKVD